VKISVILPVYNVESWLLECLESIGSQDYDDMECIVVDDCGTDRSMEICRRYIDGYSGHVEWKVVTLPHNSGVSAARNAGTEVAHGEYVMYVDSDDMLAPGAVSRLAAEAMKHPGVDLIQGAATLTDEDGYIGVARLHSLGHLGDTGYVSGEGELGRLFMSFLIPSAPWNKLVRLKLLRDSGIKFQSGIGYGEDWLWVYDLCREVRNFSVARDVTYIYRSDVASSISNTIDERRSAMWWKMVLREVIDRGVPQQSYRHEAAYRCLDIFMSCRSAGNYDDIARKFGRWLRDCGLKKEGWLLTMSYTALGKMAKKVCNTLLWRLARHRFPRPWG